ncbi:MAG: Septum formation initiator [Acidaminococcus timonensis]|jgi:cell division protein FtsL
MVNRKTGRPMVWPSHRYYTEGSAAVQEEEAPAPSRTRQRKVAPKKAVVRKNIVLRRVAFFAGLVLSLAFVNVALSELYFTRSQALVKLKSVEAQQLDENETLKIDVERLRSPERITSIATKKLGMQTARSNIYVREN